MIISWLTRHKKALQVSWGILGLLCVGLVLGFRSRVIYSQRIIPLLGLPFFLFGGVHLLLMYESWSRKKRGGAFEVGKLILFALLTGTFLVVLLFFAWYFLA